MPALCVLRQWKVRSWDPNTRKGIKTIACVCEYPLSPDPVVLMRTRCADGLRSRRAEHGDMGSAGTIWRVGDPHGEWTRRNGALDRLVMGRSGRQAYVRREAPAAGAHAGLDSA